MSKIQKITLTNFKAIKGTLEADFKGCTAIITAGNNKGKTSFLRGIPDRIRFSRPDIIVNDKSEAGAGELVLTSGEKFTWDFNAKGKDTLIYISAEGIKAGVSKEIGEKFFPALFDIDKFLQSGPKKQIEQLQKIIGIDFTDIDTRYRLAYDDRTEKNREAEKFHVKLSAMLEVTKVEPEDLTQLQADKEAERARLNTLYKENKAENDKRRKDWETAKDKVRKECAEHNEAQEKKKERHDRGANALSILRAEGYKGNEVTEYLKDIVKTFEADKKPEKLFPKEPEYITPELPDDKELKAIDAKILAASETNTKAKAYQDYIKYKADTQAAQELAAQAQQLVINIEAERKALVETAKMPAGIEIKPDGIFVDGFPLDRAQLSTSKLYMAALRIAAMNLGKVKTLHFDASFLDKNSLEEIEKWANENDLQLLIERPDYEGGEIEYHLIEKI